MNKLIPPLTIITMPLALALGEKNACSPPNELRVLWMYATYPYPYANAAAEVALLRSPDKAVAHWSPSDRDSKEIVDFEVAAHNKQFNGMASAIKLTNLKSFVDAFSSFPDGKVGRVNLVTHAMPGIARYHWALGRDRWHQRRYRIRSRRRRGRKSRPGTGTPALPQ